MGSAPAKVHNAVPKFADFDRFLSHAHLDDGIMAVHGMAIQGTSWHDGRLHTLHGVLTGQNHPHQHPGPLLGLKRLTAHFVMRHLPCPPCPKPKAVDVSGAKK